MMHHATDRKLVPRNLLEICGNLFWLCVLSDRFAENEINRYAFSRKITSMLNSSIPITIVGWPQEMRSPALVISSASEIMFDKSDRQFSPFNVVLTG